MRIFKNRGAIYFSKSNKKQTKEQRILVAALVLIIIFTVIFTIALGIKNNFSIKEFFRPEGLEITQEYKEEQVQLPKVSGKSNFVTMVNQEDKLLFVSLVQVDLDNPSYKCSVLRADTICDGSTLYDIYSRAGGENVKQAIESYMNVSFDFYIDMESSRFADFYDKMGDVTFSVENEVKYKNNGSEVPYSLRLKTGEQKIKGSTFISLIRYYIDIENYNTANELFLSSITQHICPESLNESEKLFADFIKGTDTNITVRNFSLAGDALIVLADNSTKPSTYSAEAEYESSGLTKSSLKSIKGYFTK